MRRVKNLMAAVSTAVLLLLAGCGGDSEPEPAASAETSPVELDPEVVQSELDPIVEEAFGDQSEVLDSGSGVEEGDPNPAEVPSPILSEPTSLNIENLGGHKVFAGNEEGGHRAYTAVDFDCGGTGSIETFPKASASDVASNVAGTINWEINRNDNVEVTITDYTQEDMFNINNDELLIGTSRVDDEELLVVGETTVLSRAPVERIVQYKECN